jgi:uncharacterized protein YecT (DUF1311 family)
VKLPEYYAPHWKSKLIREHISDALNEMSPKAREIAKEIEYDDARLNRIFKEAMTEIGNPE